MHQQIIFFSNNTPLELRGKLVSFVRGLSRLYNAYNSRGRGSGSRAEDLFFLTDPYLAKAFKKIRSLFNFDLLYNLQNYLIKVINFIVDYLL